MPQQDTSEIKNKIITFLKIKGPSLPIHISKEIDQSTLFSSAFISELLSEGRLKNSHMKVGSSSLHFIEGQEPRLEKFGEQYLKSKEKEAFLRIKEKKFLKDSEQEPPIRVALRAIKDFAIPFTSSKDELIWRYFTSKQEDYEKEPESKPAPIKEVIKELPKEVVKELPKEELPKDEEPKEKELPIENKQEDLNIFEKPKEEPVEKIIEKLTPKPKKRVTKKKKSSKANEKFFEKIKEYIRSKNWDILDLVGFSKTDISLKIKVNEGELLLVAYNKKRITEKELLSAHKKAKELNLNYIIISLGDLPKKLEKLLNALTDLHSIRKIE